MTPVIFKVLMCIFLLDYMRSARHSFWESKKHQVPGTLFCTRYRPHAFHYFMLPSIRQFSSIISTCYHIVVTVTAVVQVQSAFSDLQRKVAHPPTFQFRRQHFNEFQSTHYTSSLFDYTSTLLVTFFVVLRSQL